MIAAPPAPRADGQHGERGEHAADDVERDLDLGGRVQRKAAAGPEADGGQRGGERRAEEELGRRPPRRGARGRRAGSRGCDQAGRRLWTRRLVPKAAALRPPMASKREDREQRRRQVGDAVGLGAAQRAGVDRAAVDLDRRVTGGDRLLEARALCGRGGVERVDGGRRRRAGVAGAAARGAAGAGGAAAAAVPPEPVPGPPPLLEDLRAAQPCALDLARGSRCTRRGRPGGWPARRA